MTVGTQWRAKVLARRRTGRYAVVTVSAPGVAHRCRAGQFVSVTVPDDAALLLRRQLWIGTSSASGRDGGAVELIVDTTRRGGARLAALDQGATLDVLGPLGRPFSLPRQPVTALLAGTGAATATLVWLAAELGARGSRVNFVFLPPDEPFGVLDAKRLSAGVVPLARGADVAAVLATERSHGIDVVYSAGTPALMAEVADAVVGTPHQTALDTELVCSAGTCTACVVPITGRDGVARMVRACREGAVFNADLIRWDELGSISAARHDERGPQ